MRRTALVVFLAVAIGCRSDRSNASAAVAVESANASALPAPSARSGQRTPNEMGRVPILMVHVLGEPAAHWTIPVDSFANDLEALYARGYRPITVSELVDRKIDLPRGLSPVVFTFDDASPSQFRYIEKNGTLEIDPRSAVGIWLAFHAKHPDWRNKATFCALPGASAGHAFFGNSGIEGQKTEWRLIKVKQLADSGFELCDHTLWHADLAKYSDEVVQEQIARGALAIDSALPGFRVRSFALPLGVWPKNRALAVAGSWTDPKSGKVVTYHFDAVMNVSGGPNRSPFDPQFDPHSLLRVQVFGNELNRTLEALDRSGTRYVSDGDPKTVAGKPVAINAPR